MPAWVYVVAVAAVLTVVWYGWARRWLHSWRYSWARAAHAVDVTIGEPIPGAEYGSMILAEELAHSSDPFMLRPLLQEREAFLPAPVDPEPWRARIEDELSPEALNGGPTVSGPEGAMGVNAPAVQHDPGPGDGFDVVSSPSPGPDQLPPRKGGPWRPPDGFPMGQVTTIEPGPDWLEAQMADLFAWVRSVHAMEVPA